MTINVDERKLPATMHNNNEGEEEDDDNDKNDDDDEHDSNSPRHSLPNHTHNDLDVPSKKEIQHPLGMKLVGM